MAFALPAPHAGLVRTIPRMLCLEKKLNPLLSHCASLGAFVASSSALVAPSPCGCVHMGQSLCEGGQFEAVGHMFLI